MDGVLADFDKGVLEIANFVKTKDENPTEEQDTAMWAAVRAIDHFYDLLDPMPGAVEMFKRIYEKYGDRCEILTGVPKDKWGIATSREDKVNWMHRIMNPNVVVNTVLTAEKPNFCTGEDCILIDDFRKNIAKWEAAGGTGIRFIDAESTIKELENRGWL